jgi:hypothetical protein
MVEAGSTLSSAGERSPRKGIYHQLLWSGSCPSSSHTNQELSDKPRTKKPRASRVRFGDRFDLRTDTVTQRVMAATVAPARDGVSRRDHPAKRPRSLAGSGRAKETKSRGMSEPGKVRKRSSLGRREKPRHPTAKQKSSLRGKRSDPSREANVRPKAAAVLVEQVPTRK